MVLDPPKPRRRTLGRIVWPIFVTAAAVLALAVSGAGQETRSDLEYLDQLHGQVMDLSLGADAMRDVVSRLSVIERTEFVAVIDALRADLSLGLELTAAGSSSDSLTATNALYRQTLEAWNAGVSAFGSSVLVAADDSINPTVVDSIADALAELRAGDGLYLNLVAELDREEVPSPVAPMPEVVMLPLEGGLASLSAAYVEAARSPTSRMALRPGLAISQLISDPEWVVDPDNQAVLPPSETIVFSVVITNVGNVVSGPEQVQLTLTGGAEDVQLSASIDPLGPDDQTAISFDPVSLESGLVYEVSVSLVLTGIDASFEDNDKAVVFTVAEGVPEESEEEST